MPKAYRRTMPREDSANSVVDDIKERFRKRVSEVGIDPIKQAIDTKWFYQVVIDKAIHD